jgi:autoinducer 2-degrading protein
MENNHMYIVQVYIHIKPEYIEAFKEASIDNARFDVIQQADDPTRFILVEVYRTPEDPAKHKETAQYNQWREIAEPMMAEARTRTIFSNVFPSDPNW